MKKIQIIILFLICLLPFTFYALKYGFVESDSYYFMIQICNGEKTFRDTPPISSLAFSLMPCNFAAAKLLLFISLFLSTLIVAKTGELFHKNGWLAGAFIFLCPIWISEFFKFEDDQIAYPLLFLAMYSFLKGVKENKKRYQATAIGLALTASLAWKGGVFYILAFTLTFIWGIIIAIPIIVVYFKNLFGAIIPTTRVLENFPIVGAFYYNFLLLGWLETKKEYLPQLIFFFALTCINLKFIIHAMPLLAIGVVGVWNNLKQYSENIKQLFKFRFDADNIKLFLSLMLLFALGSSVIGYSLTIQEKLPTPATWEAIDYAIQKSNETGKPLKNDWSFGYWIMWKGKTPSAYGGWTKSDYPYYQNSIALALDYVDYCKELKRWKTNWRDIVVYDCPPIQ